MNPWEITYYPRQMRVEPVTNDRSEQHQRDNLYTPNINMLLQEEIRELEKDPNCRIGTVIDIYV